MTILLTGGGSAGHVMPSIALLNNLKKYFTNFFYMGSINGIEKSIVEKYNLQFFSTKTIKLDRVHIGNNLKIPITLSKSVIEAKKIIKKLKPDIIFSCGGFASLPTMLSAPLLGIKLIIHESDASIGVANKLAIPFSKKVIFGMDILKNNRKNDKFVYLGTPIREELFLCNKEKIRQTFNIPKTVPVILIMGGSLGSKTINDYTVKCLPTLLKMGFLIHIKGQNELELDTTYNNYLTFDYYNQIGDLFSIADVVVSRAGAITATELYALNKKVLFIPLSKLVSRGDQILNANYYKNKNLAEVLYQEDLTETSFLECIANLLRKPNPKNNFINPTKTISDLIYRTAISK